MDSRPRAGWDNRKSCRIGVPAQWTPRDMKGRGRYEKSQMGIVLATCGPHALGIRKRLISNSCRPRPLLWSGDVLLSLGTVSKPLFRFFPSPCYFAYLPLNYPLKSPLARTLQTFPHIHTDRESFFKPAPYQDYNEGLVLISRSGFFFHPASSVPTFSSLVSLPCDVWVSLDVV